MSRALRVEFDGAIYHIMARGVARMRTFLDDHDRRRFLEIVGEIVLAGDLVLHAFCLMPNHYHILGETPHGGLSRWMRKLNGTYAMNFNYRHGRVGPLWQGRYKAILVEEGSYFLECSRYIHLNPNRSKLTRPAERYRWSSYRNYVGGIPVADWVSTHRTLAYFDNDGLAYRAFVEAGKGEKPISPFERAFAGLVLGGEAFLARIRKLVDLDSPEQPAVAALRRSALAAPEEIERQVDTVFPEVTGKRRIRLYLYALRKYSQLRPSEIARRHDRAASTVSRVVHQVDRQAETDPELAVALERLQQLASE